MNSTMRPLFEAHIGHKLTSIEGTYLQEDALILVAVTFHFDNGLVTVRADFDRDSITSSRAEASQLQFGLATAVIIQSIEELASEIDKTLAGVWFCYDEPGHCDAVDLALDNLVLPTVKILCVASKLIVLSVLPRTGQA